jgi:hypothetical protein
VASVRAAPRDDAGFCFQSSALEAVFEPESRIAKYEPGFTQIFSDFASTRPKKTR